jgi:hypothetical protein
MYVGDAANMALKKKSTNYRPGAMFTRMLRRVSSLPDT